MQSEEKAEAQESNEFTQLTLKYTRELQVMVEQDAELMQEDTALIQSDPFKYAYAHISGTINALTMMYVGLRQIEDHIADVFKEQD